MRFENKIEFVFSEPSNSNQPSNNQSKMEAFVIQTLIKQKEENKDKAYQNNYTSYLPIKKIDGIRVCVSLHLLCDTHPNREEKDWTYRWAIEVESHTYLNNYDGEMCNFYRNFQDPETFKFKRKDIKGLTESVIEMINSLKLLRLNKMNGKFQKKDELNPRNILREEVYKLFKDADEEQLELSIKECSVCYTPTNTTTECDHSVCWSCIEKLPKHEDADEQNYASCPMCRSCVTAIN